MVETSLYQHPEGREVRGPTRARYASNLIKEQGQKMRRALTRARPAKLRNRGPGVKRFIISWLGEQPRLVRSVMRAPFGVEQDNHDTAARAGESMGFARFEHPSQTRRLPHHVKNKSPRFQTAASGEAVVVRAAMIGTRHRRSQPNRSASSTLNEVRSSQVSKSNRLGQVGRLRTEWIDVRSGLGDALQLSRPGAVPGRGVKDRYSRRRARSARRRSILMIPPPLLFLPSDGLFV